jgi:hypothetical protein
MRQVSLILGILSGQKMHERRDRCRRTWLSVDYDRSQVLPLFLIGDPTLTAPVWGGDCLWLPVPDDYPSLPQKTRAFCRWCLDNFDFTAIWKGDDDSYAVLSRLQDSLPTPPIYDYVGMNAGAKGEVPYGSGGAGYLLSPNSAAIVADKMTETAGCEDRIVGQHLAKAGIQLVEDARFRGWSEPMHWPTPDNDIISCHGIRDDRTMNAIHGGMGYAMPTEPLPPLFTIPVVKVGYNDLGLNGCLGFTIDGHDMVTPPADGTLWSAYELLSAHAPSRLEIDIARPSACLCFMDANSRQDARRPVSVSVDGKAIGTLIGNQPRNHRTREVLLDPGIHVLECGFKDRNNSRRYSVWAIRELGTPGVKILMPTHNVFARRGGPTDICLQLLNRYWPDHPQIVVARHETPVDTDVICEQYDAGAQDNCTWAQQVERYLMTSTDELVTLFLSDYAMCGRANLCKYIEASFIMQEDLGIGAWYLTWMAVHRHQGGKQPSPYAGTYLSPAWDYTVHLQAGIWRRLSLLRLLRHVQLNPWQFELEASRHHNKNLFGIESIAYFDLPDPPATKNPLFLDGNDKTEWVLPYHNLMHQGKVDDRWSGFLKEHGFEGMKT